MMASERREYLREEGAVFHFVLIRERFFGLAEMPLGQAASRNFFVGINQL